MERIDKYVWYQEGPGVRKNQYTVEGIKLLNVANLVDGNIDLSTSDRYISEEEANGKYKHFLADEGDLVIASSGIQVNYFDKKMGFIKKEHLPLCMNTSTIRFKTLDKNVTNIRYFMYFLKSDIFKRQLQKLITGSAQLNFGPSHLKKIKINMPLLENQNKAVNELDKVQEIIDTRKKQVELLDELIKSQFVEMFGEISNSKYQTVKLSSIADVGSSHRVFTTEFVENGIPFYRGTEIGMLANGEKPKDCYYISKEHYSKICDDSTKPKVGDLLLPSICNKGQVWMVDTTEPFYYKDGRVLSISPKKGKINNKYFHQFMKYKTIKEYSKLGSGSTFAEFKIFILKDFDVIVPPIELQNQFADIVKQIDKQKYEIQKSLEETQKLQDSLMNKYF